MIDMGRRHRVPAATPFTPREAGTTTPSTPRLTRIGDYDLLYRLGTGGMGNVYLARRRNESGLQRLFAVKAMHSVLSADAEFANMFLDEAHIASQLHHINVVGIVDLGRWEGRLFLVMDYVEGPTLAHVLAASSERPPALLCAIVIDLLHGLHAAHSLTNEQGDSLDLVHRDVSPSNILIGTDGVARLTDFGIAKARMRRTMTSPGVRKGKLSYSAPEQITNPGGEDARVDVFAAGVVLWNSLTGARLFDGENEASVILSVINRPIPPPSTVGLHPPACLDEVCLRALNRDPAARYRSAAEMADDLRRVTRANDLVVGPEQVAEWVARLFGAELTHRRAAIRARTGAAERPSAPMSTPVEKDADYAEILVSDAAATRLHRSRRRNQVALAVGAAAVLAVFALITAMTVFPREVGEVAIPPPSAPARAKAPAPPSPAQTAPAETAVTATAATPTATTPAAPVSAAAPVAARELTATAPEASTASASASAQESEDSSSDDASESKSHRRRRPAAPAVRRREPTRSEPEPAPAAAAKVVAPPAPATPSPPPPQSGESIESNPYLRRANKNR
jgi:hypothetical protein